MRGFKRMVLLYSFSEFEKEKGFLFIPYCLLCGYSAASWILGIIVTLLWVENLFRNGVPTYLVSILKNIPTRNLSRVWGYLCDVYIPTWFRRAIFNTYGTWFNCNLQEAVISDVTRYATFNEYFTRKLKPGSRTIDALSTLVSPADSTVVSYGVLPYSKNMMLDQIKGFTYPLDVFVGPNHPFLQRLSEMYSGKPNDFTSGVSSAAIGDTHDIFYCSLYLAPGDYHWFHSPVEWDVRHRRHIPGHLFSVHPHALRSINGIFNFNERVILSGQWEHGLLMYAAIGAYNVGSIRLDSRMEKNFHTNSWYVDHTYDDRRYDGGVEFQRGDILGGFELGSSIVVAFTAPKTFKWNIDVGQKLKYGERIGDIESAMLNHAGKNNDVNSELESCSPCASCGDGCRGPS